MFSVSHCDSSSSHDHPNPLYDNPSTASTHHPLYNLAKHVCAICGDRASGKHYGVYSCEGCKGFFKRTVRKDLVYTCREVQQCIIDRRQRNRCQFCRYQKCLKMGMNRDAILAVQEVRQLQRGYLLDVQMQTQQNRHQKASPPEPESTTSSMVPGVSRERILNAEMAFEASINGAIYPQNDHFVQSVAIWASIIPQFSHLQMDDQVMLLHSAWHDLFITSLAYRLPPHSLPLLDVQKRLADLGVDKTELSALRAVLLMNPDLPTLRNPAAVEVLREAMLFCLEDYSRLRNVNGRFAKLILLLPTLRSARINALICLDPVPEIQKIYQTLKQQQVSPPLSA